MFYSDDASRSVRERRPRQEDGGGGGGGARGGGVSARLNEIINQPPLPLLVNVLHYPLTWKILLLKGFYFYTSALSLSQ